MSWSLRGLLWRSRREPASKDPAAVARDPYSGALERELEGQDPRAWVAERRRSQHLFVELPQATVERVRELWPEQAARAIATAERVLQHEFALLGSGRFVPVDPDRRARPEGYRPIDWRLDPASGLRFPAGFHHKDWDLYRMRPGNADVKLPWELARCQHWLTLGQAYRLSGDPRFAQEIADELDDFREANPVGRGVNWTCTMDVALRAANWALGLSLVRECPTLAPEFWMRAYAALFEHGVFIRANLENNYEVTSNHFLSNVAGLLYVAAVFRGLPQAESWLEFAHQALEQEMQAQVLEDGADFESSVPYHRLATELFLGGLRVAQDAGISLSDRYRGRLRDMASFLLQVLRPDGLMPQVGDADDGRLQIASGYGSCSPQDGRHVLAVAAALLGEPGWLAFAGPDAGWEAAWWGLGLASAAPRPLPDSERLFKDAGLAVARRGTSFLLVTNGAVGTKGFGNHKHNDLLGFELHLDGIPLFVDPGSYVYTSDPAARNLFRSVAYHNTLAIDETEPNEMRPEWLFRLFETARPEHLRFRHSAGRVEYTGRHFGYQRLDPPVVHERRFRLDFELGVLQIADHALGKGRHRLRWHFHLAPGVQVESRLGGEIVLAAGECRFVMLIPDGLEPRVAHAWYSPSYGVRQACLAIEIEATVELRGDDRWTFVVGSRAGVTGREWAAELSAKEAC